MLYMPFYNHRYRFGDILEYISMYIYIYIYVYIYIYTHIKSVGISGRPTGPQWRPCCEVPAPWSGFAATTRPSAPSAARRAATSVYSIRPGLHLLLHEFDQVDCFVVPN